MFDAKFSRLNAKIRRDFGGNDCSSSRLKLEQGSIRVKKLTLRRCFTAAANDGILENPVSSEPKHRIAKLGGAESRNEFNASLNTGTNRVRPRIEGIPCNFCKMELEVAINRSGLLSSCISPNSRGGGGCWIQCRGIGRGLEHAGDQTHPLDCSQGKGPA